MRSFAKERNESFRRHRKERKYSCVDCIILAISVIVLIAWIHAMSLFVTLVEDKGLGEHDRPSLDIELQTHLRKTTKRNASGLTWKGILLCPKKPLGYLHRYNKLNQKLF